MDRKILEVLSTYLISDLAELALGYLEIGEKFVEEWKHSGRNLAISRAGIYLNITTGIQVLNFKGEQLQVWKNEEPFSLTEMAFIPNGNLFVVDIPRIKIYSPSGECLKGVFQEVLVNDLSGGIAVSEQGYVFVTCPRSNSVKIFSLEGEYLSSWGELGKGNGQFLNPYGIAILGPNRRVERNERNKGEKIYVCDFYNHRIQVFNLLLGERPEVKYSRQWGCHGFENNQFNLPISVAISSSRREIYVVDSGNCRIKVFTPEGIFKRQFKAPGQNRTLTDIAIGPDERIYLVNRVQVFESGYF
jgi:DNA-binding beta-propeller fold protein YncE